MEFFEGEGAAAENVAQTAAVRRRLVLGCHEDARRLGPRRRDPAPPTAGRVRLGTQLWPSRQSGDGLGDATSVTKNGRFSANCFSLGRSKGGAPSTISLARLSCCSLPSVSASRREAARGKPAGL